MKIHILWLLNLQLFWSFSDGTDCKREPKCEITRVHKMKTANCYDRHFYYFPKCLVTDVEVIDLTYNRIRKISKEDLSKLNYLKFLYLADNLLSHLDGDIFSDLTGLTTLDLSLNALDKVPPAIFQLPSLKSLYLGQNQNINIIDALENTRPILSPLTQIDISETSDEDNYSDFPNFGTLPFLAVLNITGNFYFSFSPTVFVGLCNMKKLVNENVTTAFEDPCDCWKINKWLKDREVMFTPFPCTVLVTTCPDLNLKKEDIQIYVECMDSYKTIQRRNQLIKGFIGGGIGLIVLCVLLVGFFYWRRKNRKNRQIRQTKIQKNVDDLSPLNNRKKSVPNEYAM